MKNIILLAIAALALSVPAFAEPTVTVQSNKLPVDATVVTGVSQRDGKPIALAIKANGLLPDVSKTPTYTVSSNGLTPTSATNVLVIESGAVKTVRLKRLTIQPGYATASGIATLAIKRNTVAATAAGTAVSGATMQRVTTDAAFSGIARIGAFTVVGVTSTATTFEIPIPTPISTATNYGQPIVIDFTGNGNFEPFTIPVGVLNGLMFTHSGLSGAAGFGITAEFTEEVN